MPKGSSPKSTKPKRVPALKPIAQQEGTETYRHDEQAIARPAVGIQPEFTQGKAPKTYRYDSSLDPQLSWDESPTRELGEWLIGLIERVAKEGESEVFSEPQMWRGGRVTVASLADAAAQLRRLSSPFLDWSGKVERQNLTVPTLPLFVHERHSTKAILNIVKNRVARGETADLFGSETPETARLEAYEHKESWVNRMILGDSLHVMNSLLEYEGLGGQVQMIYIDPPYGVKFGSNFQPFVKKLDVKPGSDDGMTREPEMVKAYRDTWELGLHSYLTYLRDRLLLARELLTESGSVFVQISDENLHYIRAVMGEVFGPNNCLGIIAFKKTGYQASGLLPANYDFICWYGKNADNAKYRQLYLSKMETSAFVGQDLWFELSDGTRRRLTKDEKDDSAIWPEGARLFRHKPPEGAGSGGNTDSFDFDGRTFWPKQGKHWSTTPEGMKRLADANRFIAMGNTLRFVNFLDDLAVGPITTVWQDTVVSGFSDPQLYVVQTSQKVIQRCLLMTTDPGDLVFDPTCGGGTTAYVAEQWGRRWITCDTSRVPLAIARQRLLTASFPYYELKDQRRGPSGGFVYKRRQNRKGEEVGGIVPHITLKSIANKEPPAEEVLVDRPEVMKGITRVSGPFVVEATIPSAQAEDDELPAAAQAARVPEDVERHIARMTEVLRQSKTIRLPGNRTLSFAEVRRLSDFAYLHSEAVEKNGADKRVAIVFGPEDGAVAKPQVIEAVREAFMAGFAQLFLFGFAIQAEARQLIEASRDKSIPGERPRLPCSWVAVTPDVAMSDLLKTTRASEVFSITGLPDIEIEATGKKNSAGAPLYRVILRGLDIFDPQAEPHEAVEGIAGDEVPMWMLDTDFDPLGSFVASQVFFPKTSAWNNLTKSLQFADANVFTHLAGTISAPFALGAQKRIAVKVIDERGNELQVVREVKDDAR